MSICWKRVVIYDLFLSKRVKAANLSLFQTTQIPKDDDYLTIFSSHISQLPKFSDYKVFK